MLKSSVELRKSVEIQQLSLGGLEELPNELLVHIFSFYHRYIT